MEKVPGQFGQMLKQLRKRDKATQHQIAELLETGRGNISNYEKGRRFPTLESLIKIAAFFQVSLDHLVFGNQSPAPDQFATIDQLHRELMAENTLLMETKNALQEEVQAKEKVIVSQWESIEFYKKYIHLLEEKLKQNS
jgi:transcriptional regulator with XRE-family HTH domain